MSKISPSGLLHVGKVLRPHGIDGTLQIQAYSGEGAPFVAACDIFLKKGDVPPERFERVQFKARGTVFLMKLRGLTSREEVLPYRGAEILVKRDVLSCSEDEFFWQDLIGLSVWLDSGEYLGELIRIIPTGSNDIYVVNVSEKSNASGKEVLIPATHEVVRGIYLEERKMVISPLEGLLDLNAF